MENRWFIVVSGDGRIRCKKVFFNYLDAVKCREKLEKDSSIIGKLYILPIICDEINTGKLYM